MRPNTRSPRPRSAGRRHAAAVASVLVCVGGTAGCAGVRHATPADPVATARLPEPLDDWGFLLGDLRVEATQRSRDGAVEHVREGQAEFVLAPGGDQIIERQTVRWPEREQRILNVFAGAPTDGVVALCRWDNDHEAFHTTRGAPDGAGRLVLLEDQPPEGDFQRRFVYEAESPDRVVRTLLFTEDAGESWWTRHTTVYTRE